MALVAFLRGVNVGGHRTFRPSQLARELSDYDVVNVGAAGTFVVRRPGSESAFRAALLDRMPFEAELVLCDGRDLLRLERDSPFGAAPAAPGVTRFLSIMVRPGRFSASLPLTLPAADDWLVRVIGRRKQFVFGEYRRHMKTIGYLGRLERLFDVPITTRNWNTIAAINRVLKNDGRRASG